MTERNPPATVGLVCGIVALAVPLTSAIPLVLLVRGNGDLLPVLVVLVLTAVLGVAGISFGAVGRRWGRRGAPDGRRATIGIWLGASAILAGILLFVVLVASAISAYEFWIPPAFSSLPSPA